MTSEQWRRALTVHEQTVPELDAEQDGERERVVLPGHVRVDQGAYAARVRESALPAAVRQQHVLEVGPGGRPQPLVPVVAVGGEAVVGALRGRHVPPGQRRLADAWGVAAPGRADAPQAGRPSERFEDVAALAEREPRHHPRYPCHGGAEILDEPQA